LLGTQPWFQEIRRLIHRLERLNELSNDDYRKDMNNINKDIERLRKEILEMGSEEKVTLKVGEAKQQRDFGRNIARIDSETMEKIGITVGDVIEIVGKRTTGATPLPAYPED